MNIKQLKPKKNGRYQQGYINPQSCKKLFPSLKNQPIIYRSSYEKKFIQWCETNNLVKFWGSECMSISYNLGQNTHRYYPDYLLEMVDGERIVIEIKPKNQTQQPINENSYAWEQWVRNKAKWLAAKEWCSKHNCKFWILTENTINRL